MFLLNAYFNFVTNRTFKTPVEGKWHKVLNVTAWETPMLKGTYLHVYLEAYLNYSTGIFAHYWPTLAQPPTSCPRGAALQQNCPAFSTIYVSCLCYREKEITDLDIKRKRVNCWKGYRLHEMTLWYAQNVSFNGSCAAKKKLITLCCDYGFQMVLKNFCQFLSNFTVLNWEKTFIIYVILCNAYIVGIWRWQNRKH